MGIITEYRLEKKYKHNILSVIFDSDSFFYAISDINNKLNIAVKYQLEDNPYKEIPEIIEKESLANHYYSTVNIFSRSKKFIFVPNAEYSYGSESAFIKNSFPIDNDEINVDLCSGERMNIIHAYPNVFQSAIHSLKSENNFRHVSLAFIEGIRSDGIFVSLSPISTTILVRDKGRFLFYNQFETINLEDALYFIMLTIDQLGLNPEESRVYLDGVKTRRDALLEILKKYIANILIFTEGFSNIENSEDLMDLYLASICE